MRKMLALATVMAVSSVHAQELSFGDVNYFLKAGEINAALDVNSAYSKYKYADSEPESRGIISTARAGYGINDQMNIYVGLEYAFDLETEDKDEPNAQDFSSDGLANPLLAFNYRYLNQNSSRYNVDFGAVARINVQDGERGYGVLGDSKDGNYVGFLEPRSSLELNARMGRKWNEANEWQLAGGLIYFNDGEVENRSTGRDIDLDSSMDFYVRATYQYRPVETFMMLVSLQGTRVGEVEGKFEGDDLTLDSHIDYDFDFVAKYLITDNFIAKFNYHFGRNSAFDEEVGNSTEEVRNRRESSYGLGVEFLF